MVENGKISVLICTFNGAKYLRAQLDSIVKQSILPSEIVVCDDCSSDITLEICSEFKKKYTHIDWVIHSNMKNYGYAKNFFEGFKMTTGDYVFFCDQDDLWDSNKVKKMVGYMKKNDKIAVLASDFRVLNESSTNHIYKEIFQIKKIKQILLSSKFFITVRPGCTFCVRGKYRNNNYSNFYDNYAHDLVIFQDAIFKNEAYICKDKLIKFRRHSSNASSSKRDQKLRLSYLYDMRNLIDLYLDKEDLNSVYIGFLNKYKIFFNKRISFFESDNLNFLSFLFYIVFHFFMFPSFRMFISEILYIIRSKK